MPNTINPPRYQELPVLEQPDASFVSATYLRYFTKEAEETQTNMDLCSRCERESLIPVIIRSCIGSMRKGFIFRRESNQEGLTIAEVERTCSTPEKDYEKPYQLRLRIYVLGGQDKIANPIVQQISQANGLEKEE